MDKAEIQSLLRGARRSSEMTTTYEIEDGPIVDGQSLGERMRVTRVVVVSYDNGYQRFEVRGKSVTKTGKDKSSHAYFHSSFDTEREWQEALLDL